MELAIKSAAAGMVAVLCASLIRKRDPELALCLCLAACAVILAMAAGLGQRFTAFLSRARELSGLSSAVLTAVVKCVGIGVVAKLGADACRDAGSAAVGSSVETAGALAALYCALPLFESLLNCWGA